MEFTGSSRGRRWLVFLGTHAPKLDEKGRLILPAKFREELAGGVVRGRLLAMSRGCVGPADAPQ